VSKAGATIEPACALASLQKGLAEGLGSAYNAMKLLAESCSKHKLVEDGKELYDRFRPETTWGKRGDFDLSQVTGLIQGPAGSAAEAESDSKPVRLERSATKVSVLVNELLQLGVTREQASWALEAAEGDANLAAGLLLR
jgi:hypothetical protein